MRSLNQTFVGRITRGLGVAAGLALLVATGGCGPNTYAFSIELKNANDQPVTAWLTKRGGPDEAEWLSPETLARQTLGTPQSINGVVVPPGKTASIGPINGKFDSDAMAILRVYSGQLSFEQILATPVDGKLRVDVALNEGANRLTVAPGASLVVDQR